MTEKYVLGSGVKEVIKTFEQGGRVAWNEDMHLLMCFASGTRPRMGNYVSRYVPPGYFDVLTKMSDANAVIGVQFWSLGPLLRTSNELIASQATDGSLQAIALLEAGEAHRLRNPNPEPTREELLAAAREFLSRNPISIPAHIWQRAVTRSS